MATKSTSGNPNTYGLGIGSRVLTGATFTKHGEIVFIGKTSFSEDENEWIGIRLDTPEGKNNGTVNGVFYFEAEELHGLFVRKWAQLKPEPAVTPPSASTRSTTARTVAETKPSGIARSTRSSDTAAASAAPAESKPSAMLRSARTDTTGAAAAARERLTALKEKRAAAAADPRSPAPAVKSPINRSAATAAPKKATFESTTAEGDGFTTPVKSSDNEGADGEEGGEITESGADAVFEKTLSRQASTASMTPNKDSALIEMLQGTIYKLTKQEDEMHFQIVELKNEIAQLTKQCRTQEKAAAESQVKLENLEEKTIDLETQLIHQTSEFEQKDQASQAAIESLTASVESLTREVELKSKQVVEMQGVIASHAAGAEAAEDYSSKYLEAAAQLEAARASLASVEHALAERSSQLESAQGENERMKSTVEAWSEKVTQSVAQSAAEVQRLTAEIEALQDEAAASAKKVEDLEASHQALQQQLEEQAGTISDLRQQKEEAVGEAGSLRSQLAAFSQASATAEANQENENTLIIEALRGQIAESESRAASARATAAKEHAAAVAELQAKLTAQQAEVKAAAERESESLVLINSLRARLAESEHKVASAAVAVVPPAAVSGSYERLSELERQLEELTDTVESLTMDKEQLTMDNELLQEQLKEMQKGDGVPAAVAPVVAPVTVAATEGGSISSEREAELLSQIKQLKVDVQQLEELSADDKEMINTQESLLEELENECADLRQKQQAAEASLEEMRQTVDSMASYESMIEKLTEQNMEYSETIAFLKQSISDLEESVELNEELDARQAQQIQEDRDTIDSLNVSIAALERQLENKDWTLAEQGRMVDRLKNLNKSLQSEVALLKENLSSESEESKHLESKLRDVSVLKAQQELLSQEISSIYNQLTSSNAQKFKYNSLFSRMDAIFGSSSFYLEESKLINTEIVYVSTLTVGFDACRMVSSFISQVVNNKLAVEYVELTQSTLGVFTLLYQMMLQAQHTTVQANVTLFREESEGVAVTSTTQLMMSFKGLYERVVQLALKLNDLNRLADRHERKQQQQQQQLAETSMEDADISIEGGSAKLSVALTEGDDVKTLEANHVTFVETVNGFEALLQEFQTLLNCDAAEKNSEESVIHLLSRLEGIPLEGSAVSVPLAEVEMYYVSLNSLCEVALYKHHQALSEAGAEQPSPAREQAVTVEGMLRSIKIDLKASIFNLKQHKDVFTRSLPAIKACYRSLLACFEGDDDTLTLITDTEALLPRLKAVLTAIRSINTVPTSAAASARGINPSITIGISGILKFFPVILLTNIGTAGDTQEESLLRDQFNQSMEKYWNLLIQGNSDLLAAAATAAADGGDATLSNSIEVSWKYRVGELRTIISLRLGSLSSGAAGGGPLTPKKGGASAASEVHSPHVFISNEQHRAVVHELDIKKDELKSALKKCAELQALCDAAAEKLKAGGGGGAGAGGDKSTNEEVQRLRNEVKVLEAALEATEQRVEAMDREKRTSPLPKEKAARRRTQADSGDTATAAGGLAAAAGSANNSSMSSASFFASLQAAAPQAGGRSKGGSGAASAETVSLLLEQVSQWKKLALTRLTQSLAKLPDLHEPVASSSSSSVSQQLHYPAGNVVKQPNVFAKHFELVGYDKNTSHAEYKDLYRKIRLMRASSIRIKAISDRATVLSKTEAGPAEGCSGVSSARSRVLSRSHLIYRIAPVAEQ